MTAQYIELGDRDWSILIYYDVNIKDFFEISDSLIQLDCSRENLRKGLRVLRHKNTGFTFTNTEYKMSIVCISRATSVDQMISTAIHEIKHVLSHICSYYGVSEKSEEAAYLIGYIAKRMYKTLSRVIKTYV